MLSGRLLCALSVVLLLAGCSGDDLGAGDSGSRPDLGPDRTRNLDVDADVGDDDGDLTAPDLTRDTGNDDSGHLICSTDDDDDGWVATACGGRDCDDGNPAMNPGLNEGCDFFDNNCDELLNNGINCTFYASTDDALYAVDPFQGTAERITDAPSLWDIDTHPSGTLYGVNADALFLLDPSTSAWIRIGDLDHSGGDANGMAIDLEGVAYLTADNDLYTIDLTSGQTAWVGAMGGGFESSGDCVVNKDNSLFLSSRHLDGTDSLVLLDGNTGLGTQIGAVGFDRIYGLTAAWGHLFGLTSEGELISIDELTGAAELITTFSGRRWFGAASTPSR